MIRKFCLVSGLILIGIWIPVEPAVQLEGESSSKGHSPPASPGCELGPNGRMCYFIISEPLNQTEAEGACASRGAESHLVAATDRTTVRHVNYMLTSRHLREAWIGAEYDALEEGQGRHTADNIECGYFSNSSSKAVKWQRKNCSDKLNFHCSYTRESESLTSCRYDFVRCGKYCIRQASTMFQAPRVDWYHAAEFCLSLHTELPPVRSEAEAEEWLRDTRQCNLTSPRAALDTWTNHTNLHWHWTTGEAMKYTRWLPDSPQPQVGRCVKMTIGNHLIEIGFRSEACDKKLPAVCQISSTAHSSYSNLWDPAYHTHHHHHPHHHHHHHRQTRDQSREAPPDDHVTRGPPGGATTPGERSASPRQPPNPQTPRPGEVVGGTGGDTQDDPYRPGSGGQSTGGQGPGGSNPGGNKPNGRRTSPRPPQRSTTTHVRTYPTQRSTSTTEEPSSSPRPAPPMEWSHALIIGLVGGGAAIFLLVVLVGVAVCCCCRRRLPGCSTPKTLEETSPVRPSVNHLDNPNYDSTGDNMIPSRAASEPNTYIGLENRTSYENAESTGHQYTKLQPNGGPKEAYYYEIPSEDGGQNGRAKGRAKMFYSPPEKKVATPLAERRLPAIPGEGSGVLALRRLYESGATPGTRVGGEQWEYLEVIEPPGEERPSRQPSNVSQKSQDSGIDLKG